MSLSAASRSHASTNDMPTRRRHDRAARAATLIMMIFALAPAHADTGLHRWSKRIASGYATSVSQDSRGNTILTGSAGRALNAGCGVIRGKGGADYFLDAVVAKYSSVGRCLWSRVIRASGVETMGGGIVIQTATDPAGNVVVAGWTTSNAVDFGGGRLRGGFADGRGSDIVVAKYSAAGRHLWSKRIPGQGFDPSTGLNPDSSANAVAVDRQGNILLTGYTNCPVIDFGGRRLTRTGDQPSVSYGYQPVDLLLAKLSPSGRHVWSKRFTATQGGAVGNAVGTDGSGNVLLAGRTDGVSLDLGGGPLYGLPGSPVTGPTAVVAKYSGAGAHMWSRRTIGDGTDAPIGIAGDAAGNTWLTGITTSSTTDFGGGPLPRTSADYAESFLAKYSPTGEPLWAKRPLGAGMWVSGLSVTPSGRAFLVGSTLDETSNLQMWTLLFRGGLLSYTQAACIYASLVAESPEATCGYPTAHLFVAKYSSGGDRAWLKMFAGNDSETSVSISSDATGNIAFTANTRSRSVDLGGGALSGSGPGMLIANYSVKG